jgi:pyruvate/2-oxoglutarate/acetoin dehydrogenase E1 component
MPELNQNANGAVIQTATAIRDGLLESAKRDPNVIFMAEGIEDPTGVFGTLSGIGDVIGSDRMIETPVAENATVGAAIGAAMAGKRPVVSFHRVEFALLAMEQIINNAAKMNYLSRGKHPIPIVIRLVVGRGWGQGPNHSQSLESLFSHIPGLKVILPTFPSDAKGLITAAVEDQNPVICIENRWCHYVEGRVPNGYYSVPLDGPKIIREGSDFTVVSTSYMTLEAKMAAEKLSDIGVDVEILDLRVTRPLQIDKIEKSVRKTGHLLTVDLGWVEYGIGAEIIASTVSRAMDALKAPPQRLGVAAHPTPSSRGLISQYYPDAVEIARNICETIGLSENKKNKVLSEIREMRTSALIDTPHPAFKGPF